MPAGTRLHDHALAADIFCRAGLGGLGWSVGLRAVKIGRGKARQQHGGDHYAPGKDSHTNQH
ncbi:hypothetical protein LP421_18520 [Rhizobium sp. RCAM05350]|nr:hypothetical protein LP421_18520 [Rhizobium sp. RCAM05350]